jgi:branched-chain amino acid transport system substrate-binding protein
MKFTMGDHTWKGAELAATQINAAGGILIKDKRYQFALTKADDNSYASIPDAVSAMERLLTVKKVDFVIGGHRSEAVLAQQEVMADNKVIFLGTAAIHKDLNTRVAKNYERYKYWFKPCPISMAALTLSYIAATEPIIRTLRTNLGIEKPKVAIMADKAIYAEGPVKLVKKIFPQLGCEVVGEWRPSFMATSVAAELSAIKSAGAHMIFQIVSGPAGNIYSRQWGELQIPVVLVGLNMEGQLETHWKTTDGNCNYMETGDTIGNAEKTKKTRPFLDAFFKKYGNYPLSPAIGTYDSLHILKDAIERAGMLDTNAVIRELEKTDYIGPNGRITFTQVGNEMPHDVIWSPENTWVGMQWRDGKRFAFWPDGHEMHEAILAEGAPRGWDKVRYKGTTDYVLPPWVVEYWKDKSGKN